jgi:hypothetical protein
MNTHNVGNGFPRGFGFTQIAQIFADFADSQFLYSWNFFLTRRRKDATISQSQFILCDLLPSPSGEGLGVRPNPQAFESFSIKRNYPI